jgi:(2S)-methylsuccinyl-CoA dehydrogenase
MSDLQHINAATANKLLQGVRVQLNAGVDALARACTANGKLDSKLLDDYQHASFEIAWVYADILAAETLVDSKPSDVGDLDWSLACIFVTEAITSSLPRLEALFLDRRMPLQGLQKISSDAEVLRKFNGPNWFKYFPLAAERVNSAVQLAG